MLAPISWLKDYVDIEVSPNQLAKKLVAIGFEVADIIYQEKQASGVVVGKIVEVEKHPNADRLRVTKIDIGNKIIQVVTNVPVVGQETIAVALDGAQLYGGNVIKRGELRGVLSEGMLCGLEEVGLTVDDAPNQKQGDIIRFEEGTALGQNALVALGYNDVILDVEITANRPDCNSIYKLAKEVAVALKTTCRNPHIHYEVCEESVDSMVSVDVQCDELCPRYMAAAVKDIKIFPSSQLIKSRLRAVGIRPINNIVDITNYVLTEIGQPMHSFDERELEGDKIVVRRALEGESIVSLDGKQNKLDNSMLVICDANRPVAIAGIMGGANSGIQADTTKVVFESAKFARDSVRHTSKALGLRSDSSARFEKGIDFASQELGLKRALTLVYESGSGIILDGIIDCVKPYQKVRKIEFTVKKLQEILGCRVPKNTLIAILTRLGIEVQEQGSTLVALVGEDREDIVGVNDIAEEFIRVYGYSHIQPTLFEHAALTDGGKSDKMLLVEKLKQILSAYGLSEIVTYSFVTPRFADLLKLDADHEWRKCAKIANPLGEELSVMRTNLVHSMLETLKFNYTHFNKSAWLFEQARVYLPNQIPMVDLPNEKEMLVIGMYGDDADYFTIKGAVEHICQKLALNAKFVRNTTDKFLHPGRSASVLVGEECIGFVGEAHPDVASNYEIDNYRVYLAQLDVEKINDLVCTEKQRYQEYSRLPIIDRDLAVVVADGVLAGDMVDAIKDAKIKYLDSVRVFDTYKSAQIGEGKKSVALTFCFSNLKRTLTDEEIAPQMKRILRILSTRFGARIR